MHRYRFGRAASRIPYFPAADFADTDHVWGLAHSVLYRRLPVYGVDADFALGKDAAARFVDKLNRVFDGNDMVGQGFVAVFEHSRHRGGFARTGRPDDNQQPARCDGEVFEFSGKPNSRICGMTWLMRRKTKPALPWL